MGRNYERIGAATGAFFVIAIIVGSQMEFSGWTAATDGPGILANLQRDPTIVNRIGFTWALLGFAAFLVFLGYLHRVLRRAEGPDGWLATIPLGPACCTWRSRSGRRRRSWPRSTVATS